MKLENYGFTVWDVNETNVTYTKKSDYIDDVNIFIKIDFKHGKIEFFERDENAELKPIEDGIHVDIIKASIAILESGKIEIDFNRGK